MNISEHALKRYVERIMGKTSTLEINLAIQNNKEMIVEYINKLLNYSKLVYEGNIGEQKTHAQFFIKDDIALVVDKNKNNIITIYRITFNFPQNVHKSIIDSLRLNIEETELSIIQKELEVSEFSESNQNIIDTNTMKIQSLLEEVSLLKKQNDNLKEAVVLKRSELALMHTQLKESVYSLFAMTDYKRDIKDLSL